MAKVVKATAYGECTIISVDEPFSVILSNESQSIPTDANRKTTKDFTCYTDVKVSQGTTPHTDFIIGDIPSANGITVTKSSARINFTVKAGTTILADTGTFNIPITLGEDTVTKVFSWSCQKEGVAAKSVKVVADSTVFKSTDGGTTFSPDTVRITPTFQGGITFSKWQYSIDGGTTWKDVVNGEHGLTISSSTLIVTKNSDLYTDKITSISFKCVSNDITYYDITTITKMIDSTDGELGGVNIFVKSTTTSGIYLTKTGTEVLDELWGYSDYIDVSDVKNYIASGFTNLGTIQSTCFYKLDKSFLSGVESEIENSQDSKRKSLPIPSEASYMRFSFFLADIDTLKIEKGTHSSSYSPSPSDVENSIKTAQSSISQLEFTVDKQEKEITSKVSQDTYKTDLEVINNSLANSNEGIDKWLVSSYLKSIFPDEYQDKCNMEMFMSKDGITANQTLLLDDKKLNEPTTFTASDEALVFYALTFVYFTDTGVVTTTSNANGKYALYINGVPMAITSEITKLSFTEGWNCIEVIINASDNICNYYFEQIISDIKECQKMNCYEGIITGRTTSIQSKTAEFIVSLNGINSRVSDVESGVSTNEGQIRELSSKYSSLEQDATQFKTTVSQTYAKKDDFNEIGARNLIRNSNELIFDDYAFEGQVSSTYTLTDSNGNSIIDSTGNTLKINGNYTLTHTGKQLDDMVTEVM